MTSTSGGTASIIGATSASRVYDCDTTRRVRARVTNGQSFSHWSGAASGTSLSASVRLDRNETAKAHFDCRLTVTSTSGGTAVIKGTAATRRNFACDSTQKVTAKPANLYYLSSWTGATATGTVNQGQVTLRGNKTVTANFRYVCNDHSHGGFGPCVGGGGEPDAPP